MLSPDEIQVVNYKREIAEMEKDKNVRIEFHMRCDAFIILNHLNHEWDGNVARLTNKELEVLPRWKDVPVSKMGNMASKRVLYQQLVGDR